MAFIGLKNNSDSQEYTVYVRIDLIAEVRKHGNDTLVITNGTRNYVSFEPIHEFVKRFDSLSV